MREHDTVVVTGLVLIMLAVLAGSVIHVSPRFAGSAIGGFFGVTGAILMLVPLAYSVVKRIKPIRNRVTRHVTMRTLLAWHIYAGLLGPLLVLIHSGHKFESVLGVALTALTLIVVLSGYVGRYLMRYIGQEVREKRALASQLHETYDALVSRGGAGGLAYADAARLSLGGDVSDPSAVSSRTVADLVASIADVELAIRSHEVVKGWFTRWLRLHIVLSAALYVLLALHVWAGIHFGLRWFS